MITMKMRNKDSIYLSKVNMSATELHLGTLATIHHKAFATHLNNLGRGTMLKGGQSTATPQYMYFKWFQN